MKTSHCLCLQTKDFLGIIMSQSRAQLIRKAQPPTLHQEQGQVKRPYNASVPGDRPNSPATLSIYNAPHSFIPGPSWTASDRSPHSQTPVLFPRPLGGPGHSRAAPAWAPRFLGSPQAARQSICRGSFSKIGTGSKASCMAAGRVAATVSR